MTENPYQSPLSSEHSELSPQERRGLGGWAMVVIGSTTGALTIGISGAVGAALLFVVGGSSLVFAAAAPCGAL